MNQENINPHMINSLLRQISLVNKRYEETAKLTGDNFNIFEILRLTSDENTLHSRLLAELLNTRGRHGQGSVFLKLFLKKVNILDFEPEHALIQIEKYAGPVTPGYASGGRIDIAIKDRYGKEIFIENKIYAGDQPRQLYRYHKFNPKAKILYLTLDGKPATEYTLNGLDKEKYTCISYKEHISEWLEECLKEAFSLPFFRETIRQYIYAIKDLTGQSRSGKMSKEIIEKIYSEQDNVDAARSILNAFGIDFTRELVGTRFAVILEKELGFKSKNWKKNNYLQKEISQGLYIAFKPDWLTFGVIYENEADKDSLINILKDEKLDKNHFTNGAQNPGEWTSDIDGRKWLHYNFDHNKAIDIKRDYEILEKMLKITFPV
jgi:hypothetical protein